MGVEIDLLKDYPKTKRDIKTRGKTKTEEHRTIARKFGREFFDGSRDTGYGGVYYASRFWQPVVPLFKSHFRLDSESSVLDVGCAKGYFLYDLRLMIPGIKVEGVDISEYAINHSKAEIRDCVRVAAATALPYEDDSFDIVTSITTVHNLERDELIIALQEIERVSRRGSFITVDAYHNEEERKAMEAWNLTAKTVLHVDDWKCLFEDAGYTGDYYWFLP